jgi:PilZ domain-containing protein
MTSDDERRRHPRVRLDGRATGRATVFTDFRVTAISESGASLRMAAPLALDSSCDITLNLSHVAIDLKGRVVHVEAPPEGDGDGYEIGVDFVEVDELDHALLLSFLDRERQRANA